MSLHRMHLEAPKKEDLRVDHRALENYLEGESDLADGLGLSQEDVDALRHQAFALYETGRWDRCRDVALGLAALGRVHLVDAIMLERCYRELGHDREARLCGEHVERLLLALDIDIPREATL